MRGPIQNDRAHATKQTRINVAHGKAASRMQLLVCLTAKAMPRFTLRHEFHTASSETVAATQRAQEARACEGRVSSDIGNERRAWPVNLKKEPTRLHSDPM